VELTRTGWDREPWNEPAGPDAQGLHSLYRCYPCADQWIFLATGNGIMKPVDAAEALGQVPVLTYVMSRLSHAPGHEQLQAALVKGFAKHPADEVCRQINSTLRHLGFGAVPITSLSQVRKETTSTEMNLAGNSFQFLKQPSHPLGKPVTMFAPISIRPMRAQALCPTPMEKYGHSTRRILMGLGGCTEDEVDAMIKKGVASESWSSKYLPS
jgi:crotonobetainyl-CoA:carnitine CoA-transferase CaiB-like acyl-CoA transferase